MRELGKILKRFWGTESTQYWICVPSEMDSKTAKEDFIFDTIEFLNSKIKIIDNDTFSRH
tara:strand:- start:342 stop:521 length:180 start_codon:yes stop_codon:yes gene_type:complete